MVKSVLTRKLVPVDYDGNGTLDLGFFAPATGGQGRLGVFLLAQSSGLPTGQAVIGANFLYGQTGWVPGFYGKADWLLNGAALLSPDFNGDGKTDQIFGRMVFDNSNIFQGYEIGTWLMNGTGVTRYRSLVSTNGQAAILPASWTDPALYNIGGRGSLGDFNGDGTTDLLLLRRNSTTGTTEVGLWLINDGVTVTQQTIQTAPAGWNLVNSNDFDGNGTTDLLFTRSVQGGTEVGVWTLRGTQITAMASVNTAPAGWEIVDTNDFSGDGKADILWTKAESNGSTRVGLWTMNGTQASAYGEINVAPAGWNLIDHNDFNGDGKADLLFKRTLGDGRQDYGVWLLNGASAPLAYRLVDTIAANSNWVYHRSGDTNGDGIADLLFYNQTSKNLGVWQLGSNGLPTQQRTLGALSGDWQSPFQMTPFTNSPATVTIAATDANGGETVPGTVPNAGQFTLTRSGTPSNSALTVNLAISGTAINGVDYSTIPNTITFAPGATTAVINLNVMDDSLVEGTESAVLTVMPGSNYVVGSAANATANIIDNDVSAGTFTLYTIGNSLTDQLRHSGFDRLVESQGITLNWGRHMIPGAPLEWIYNNPNQGFTEQPYGYYPNALPNHRWSAITLQPFDRLMPSDLDTINKYLSLLDPQNKPDVYIYAQWPKLKGQQDWRNYWETHWNKPYTNQFDDTNTTKDYYEKLVVQLRAAQPDFNVYMIPVGHVMEEVDRRMEAGLVPGYTDITDVYDDDIHLNYNIGSYIVASTFYATIFKKNPSGLPIPPEYQPLSSELAGIIQDAVWDIVPTVPLAGF
jgi:hypothetical protein